MYSSKAEWHHWYTVICILWHDVRGLRVSALGQIGFCDFAGALWSDKGEQLVTEHHLQKRLEHTIWPVKPFSGLPTLSLDASGHIHQAWAWHAFAVMKGSSCLAQSKDDSNSCCCIILAFHPTCSWVTPVLSGHNLTVDGMPIPVEVARNLLQSHCDYVLALQTSPTASCL